MAISGAWCRSRGPDARCIRSFWILAVLWEPALAGPFGGDLCLFVGKKSGFIEHLRFGLVFFIGFRYGD